MSEVLANFVFLLATVLTVLILARVIISWVSPGSGSAIATFVYSATEPILAPIRSLMPSAAGFDFSPMIAILILQVITRIFGQMR
jgi:YggT family protein